MRTNLEARLPTAEGEIPDSLTDLTEALSAVGNYLSAVNSLVVRHRRDAQDDRIVKTLEKALTQHERSVSALRRLRVSQPPNADGWP